MKIKRIYLSQKRGGNGYISSFSVSIGKNEAQSCGFIQDDRPLLMCKIIDEENGQIIIKPKRIVCDNTSLLNSWRCSKNVCQFITDNLGIRIGSNRSDEDNTTIEVVTDSVRIAEYTRNNSIVKLHYQNGSKKGYMHKNWGETKGEDKYTDVCVLLNKTTSKKMAAGKLAELAPMTKNKLYVAITRAKGNVYIFDE